MTANIQIEDYSEKSFVLRGETREFRDQIKGMGGKWNGRLTDKETGEKFGAWLFWAEKRQEVKEWLDGDRGTKLPSRISADTRLTRVESGPFDSNGTLIPCTLSLSRKIDNLTRLVTLLCDHFELESSQVSELHQASSDDEEKTVPHRRLLTK